MDKIFEYLPEKKFFLHYWTEDEVRAGIAQLGWTLDTVSELKGYKREPLCLKTYEVVRTGTVSIYVETPVQGYRGKTLSGYIQVPGVECRIPKSYFPQATDLIRLLLETSVPELKGSQLRFSVYAPHGADHYELYLQCAPLPDDTSKVGASLYCPLRAILNRDWAAIVKRHRSYMTEFYGSPQARADAFLDFALHPLVSPEGLELKRILTENKGA